MAERDVVDRLVEVPDRLESIEGVSERALMEEDQKRIDVAVKELKHVCEMYEEFSDSFSGYNAQEDIIDVEYSVDFGKVDSDSDKAVKLMAAEAAGYLIEDTASYIIELFVEKDYIEAANDVGAAVAELKPSGRSPEATEYR